MAKKPTDKQLFKMKNEWMGQFYERVSPRPFYRDVFPEGSFERKGCPEDSKSNGVVTVIDGEKPRNYLVFDDLETIDDIKGTEFAIISPVGYSGRNRTAKNARWLYGIGIDLDGVGMAQLRDVFHQMKHEFLPQCTYCVNSGHGLHLYYLLEKPVPLYRHLHDRLRDFKYELIAKIWNRYTSTYTERDQVQYQGIFQGFRAVGTQTKLGKRYIVTAFKTGERVTIEYLNTFLMDKSKALTDFGYKSALELSAAKEKYPEWYERRVVRGEDRGRWHIKRDLYDWWLRKLKGAKPPWGIGTGACLC
uniref:Plasmid pS23 DNA n=1 Tax=Selenomonas ruminantium TaxID=971 RepID=Q55007_SELRU|nr:ORF A [Selenomonas ruminantium subsp. ruminantium]